MVGIVCILPLFFGPDFYFFRIPDPYRILLTLGFSRSAASEIGTKMISPAAETNDPNKPPGIICDFFAKGWCIRGASCRFIHAKDNVKNSHPQIEGDVLPL